MGAGKGKSRRANLNYPVNPVNRVVNSAKYTFLVKEGFSGMPISGRKADEFSGVVVGYARPSKNRKANLLVEIVLNMNDDVRVGQIFLSGRKGLMGTLVKYETFKDASDALKYAQEGAAQRTLDMGADKVF